MAFETGTATSVTDLVQKLATFLTSAGWTINRNAAESSNWWVNAQKGSDLFLNFVANVATGTSSNPGPYLDVYGATSYNSGAASSAQPNTSSKVSSNKMPGPFTAYWFFEGDDYVHIVVEVESGRFRHIHGGTIEKVCTLTGGHYVMGTNVYYSSTTPSNPASNVNTYPWEAQNSPSNANYCYLRADAGDGVRWFTNYSSGTTGTRISGGVKGTTNNASLFILGLEAHLFSLTPNDTNGITPLVPINVIVEKASGMFSFLGQPKDVRRVSMRNYTGGDIITIGSDEWYVFPWTVRSETVNDATTDKSSYFGFAYKKNTG